MESYGAKSDAEYLSGLDVGGASTARKVEPGGSEEVWSPVDTSEPPLDERVRRSPWVNLNDGYDFPLEKKDTGRLSVVWAKTIEEHHVEWLDPEQVIPLGSITMVQGDPKLGKSKWTFWQAARVTQGGHNVLISSLEDSWGSVIKPGLRVAGADLEKVGFVECDGHPGFSISLDHSDIRSLEGLVEQTAARLLVVDPFMGHLSVSADSYRAQIIRKAMQPLAQMAERHNMAVIVVNHVGKDRNRSDLYRGDGSLGGVAGGMRSVLMFDVSDGYGIKDPYRTLKHVACNYRELALPQEFILGETDGHAHIRPRNDPISASVQTDDDGYDPLTPGGWL